MALSEEELDEIMLRCAAATPGPWTAWLEGRDHFGGSSCISRGSREDRFEDLEITGATEADYDFIAHARQDVPRLVEAIKALKKQPGAVPSKG